MNPSAQELKKIRAVLRATVEQLDAEHDRGAVATMLIVFVLRRLLEDGFKEDEVVDIVRRYFSMPEAIDWAAGIEKSRK